MQPNSYKSTKLWHILLGFSISLMVMMFGMIGYLVWEGVDVWGLNQPVGWGWAIVNFVSG